MRKILKEFYERNKILTICSIIAGIIVLSFYATIDIPEVIPGIGKWYNLLNDLSIGVLINLIFFIFQIYIPELKDESENLNKINRLIVGSILNPMNDIIQIYENNVVINKDNKIEIKQKVFFYIIGGNERGGWMSKFDFKNDVSNFLSEFEDNLKSVIQLLIHMRVNSKITSFLIDLKLSLFLERFEIATIAYNFDNVNNQWNFPGLLDDFNEFKELYYKLSIELKYKGKKFIIPNETEVNGYLQQLEIQHLPEKILEKKYVDPKIFVEFKTME